MASWFVWGNRQPRLLGDDDEDVRHKVYRSNAIKVLKLEL
jgi:hypothetical protein